MIILITFLLFFLPLVFLPTATVSAEIPKVFLFESATGVLLSLTFLKRKFIPTKLGPSTFPYLVLISLALTQLIIGRGVLFGDTHRLQGLLLTLSLLVFSLLSSKTSIVLDKPLLISIPLVLLSLSAFYFVNPENGRAIGTLGEPNALAACLNFFWPFLILSPKLSRRVKVSLFTLTAVTIIQTGSRSGVVSLLLEIIFLGLIRIGVPHLRTLVISFVIMFSSYTLPLFDQRSVFENRVDIWKSAILAGAQASIIGNGFGNIITPIRQAATTFSSPIRFQTIDSAHNLWLDWWIQGGLLGLASFVWLIAASVRHQFQEKNILTLALTLGLLTSLSFNPGSVVNLIHLWWIIRPIEKT